MHTMDKVGKKVLSALMQCSAKCFYQGFAAQIRSSRLVNTHQNIRPAFLYSRNILNILDKYKFIKSLSTILK